MRADPLAMMARHPPPSAIIAAFVRRYGADVECDFIDATPGALYRDKDDATLWAYLHIIHNHDGCHGAILCNLVYQALTRDSLVAALSREDGAYLLACASLAWLYQAHRNGVSRALEEALEARWKLLLSPPDMDAHDAWRKTRATRYRHLPPAEAEACARTADWQWGAARADKVCDRALRWARWSAATRIQRAWRVAVMRPDRVACRRRLLREWREWAD